MTHGSKHEVKYNYCVLGGARRGPLIPSGENPRTLGVRDPQCDPKRSVAQNKTHGYHIDFELCDRSRD